MDQRLGILWLKEVFEPATAAIKPLPQLLILDGHGSHVSFDFIEFCVQENILLLCLPAHSTHLLQPLDVGLFSPYQHYYGRAVDDYMRSGQNEYGIKKAIFIRFLTEAREKTFTIHNICRAFEATGIWPLCARRVLGKMSPDDAAAARTRRDTLGTMTAPRTSKDIRHRILTAQQLLHEGLGRLTLQENTSSLSTQSQPAGVVLVARVTAIMQQLGHQLETEIAQGDLYREQSRRLQGVDKIYNQTDRRLLSEARILSGATLIVLRDKRLAKDAAKAEKALARGKKSKKTGPASKAVEEREVTIAQTPITIMVDSDSDGSSWDDVPILISNIPLKTVIATPRATRKNAKPASPFRPRTRLIPDRPLHMALRSRRSLAQ